MPLRLDDLIQIDDDRECEAICVKMGLTHALKDGLSKFGGRSAVCGTPAFTWRIKGGDCHAVILRWGGFKEAKDNGYKLLAVPVQAATLEEFCDFCARVIGRQSRTFYLFSANNGNN